jgi:hypothetical protein
MPPYSSGVQRARQEAAVMATPLRISLSLGAIGCAVTIGSLGCGDSTNVESTASASEALAATALPPSQQRPGGEQGQPSSKFVAANQFRLNGGDIHVSYGPVDGLPAFVYVDARQTRTFTGRDITTTETPAGTLVSVVILSTVDSGSTTFSVLIPPVEVGVESSAPVQTQGITTWHSFSIVPQAGLGQLDQYGFTALQGIASHVEQVVISPSAVREPWVAPHVVPMTN